MNSRYQVRVARLDDPGDARDVLAMVEAYSRHPLGSGAPLPEHVRARLIDGLRAHPTTLIFLAHEGDVPVGVAICFGGYGTFAARPLVNIHDLFVIDDARGQGVGRSLLAAVEVEARSRGCCKVTLEVVENNDRARAVYETFGFQSSSAAVDGGPTYFLTKKL